MAPTSDPGGAMAPTSGSTAVSGGAGAVSGSGSRTSAMGRFGASRGIVASSPTAGNPLVSMRSAGADWLKVMPEEAV